MIYYLAVFHVVATGVMVTIVCFVHVVQYPLLRVVSRGLVPEYEREYTRRAGYIIAPVMLIEAGSAIALLVLAADHRLLLCLNVALLAFIWFITFFISVPAHEELSRAWSEAAHRRLMWSNGIRLVVWCARILGALVIIGPGH